MSSLTLNNPLPHRAGAFHWPEIGFTAFEPKRANQDAFSVQFSRIEFPHNITFLRVNEVLVVANPLIFTDEASRDSHRDHLLKAAATLRELGLYVVTDTFEMNDTALIDDEQRATDLLHRFIADAIENADVNGAKALNVLVFTTSSCELAELYLELSARTQTLLRLFKQNSERTLLSIDGYGEFFRHFGMFLEHVNGNFVQVSVPSKIDTVARRALKQNRSPRSKRAPSF